jgi:hypothetical protein
MAYELVTLKTLKELSSAGAVRAAHAIATNGGFAVQFTYGMVTRTLQAKRGNPRIFKTLDAAAKTVRGVGVAHLNADLANWNPGEASLRTRDEKALAIRQVQKAMTTIRRRAASLTPDAAQQLVAEAVAYAHSARR